MATYHSGVKKLQYLKWNKLQKNYLRITPQNVFASKFSIFLRSKFLFACREIDKNYSN